MVASIIITTLFLMACVIALVAWVCYVIVTWGRPRRPKRQLPATPSAPVILTRLPAPKPLRTSPAYLPRWGFYRRHLVATEKAEWDKDFNRLLR